MDIAQVFNLLQALPVIQPTASKNLRKLLVLNMYKIDKDLGPPNSRFHGRDTGLLP